MSSDASSRPPMNQRAVLSLGLAVIGFVLLAFQPFLSLVLSLPAVTIGAQARRDITNSDESARGFDLAGNAMVVAAATVLLSTVALFLDLL